MGMRGMKAASFRSRKLSAKQDSFIFPQRKIPPEVATQGAFLSRRPGLTLQRKQRKPKAYANAEGVNRKKGYELPGGVLAPFVLS